MLNGFYLCLSWWAIMRGMPAGIMSLLGALQPLMVAVASFALLGERLEARSWTGLAVAITGVVCVLLPAIEKSGVGSVDIVSAAAAILGVLAMTAGTMIQRGGLASDPIRVSGAVQNCGGAAVAIVATVLLGEGRWDGSATLRLGLGWSVLALSAAGLSLLVWMVRHQGATRVSALLLLVPALAAIEAWWLFGEKLGSVQITGFLLALGGVLLARARKKTLAGEPA
jgi:drug/metabolite transporter (DMT)-like permease